MNPTEAFSYISLPFSQVYGSSRNWVRENPHLAKIGFAVTVSFSLIGLIYRRLHQSDVLPFDDWKVTLGIVARPRVDINRDQLPGLMTRFSPIQLAAAFYSYLSRAELLGRPPENPNSPEEYLDWMTAHFNQREALLPLIDEISPAYNDRHASSIEDANEMAVQTWATTVQQWVALLGWNTLSMTDNIFQSVRSSPRLAYTILFHFVASFVTQKIWESIEDLLPEPLARLKNIYMAHRLSIALGSLAVVGFLYYRMKQEKGILKNLTKTWGTFQRGHKRYDLIPSYNQAMKEVLFNIGKSAPGEKGSNILWSYQKQAHMTFGEEIGEALAEATAAGRHYNQELTLSDFPHLKNLQVLELDLEEFLTEHRDADSIYKGWNDTMKNIAEAGNAVVILKGLSVISHRMFPEYHRQGEGGGWHPEEGKDPSKILTSLVALSLRQGKFRCLMVLDEQEKDRLKHEFDFLFTKIKAPDLTPDELEKVVTRLYASPEVGQPLPARDLQGLFNRMKFVLDKTPFAPSDIIFSIKDAQRIWEQKWRNRGDKDQDNRFKKIERDLNEAQQIKEQLLQKFWELRNQGREAPLPLLQALVMVEKVLLPLYTQTVVELKKDLPSAEQSLVSSIQKRFARFFGPCTAEEHQRLRHLPTELQKKIRGQDLPLQAVGTAIEQWRVAPTDDGKPLVLFFAGPPGAGKTQTTSELAFQLNTVYGIAESVVQTQESNIKRINLNREKQGAFLGWDVIKIQILEFILKTPTCVIVFEEWDKMPENDRSSLLELLEGTRSHIEGVYTQNQDRPFVEKRCTTFVITANTAGEDLVDPIDGYDQQGYVNDVKLLKQKVSDSFSEEKKRDGEAFISRIDAFIPFRGISQEAGTSLINTYLENYVAQGILKREQFEQVKEKIPQDIQDGRKLQKAVQEAVFQVVTNWV